MFTYKIYAGMQVGPDSLGKLVIITGTKHAVSHNVITNTHNQFVVFVLASQGDELLTAATPLS